MALVGGDVGTRLIVYEKREGAFNQILWRFR